MIITFMLSGCATPARQPPAPGIQVVAIGPAIAQVVQALAPGRLVAVDTASHAIPALAAKPAVGFSREVSAEGVLSVGPTLVLADEQAGPPEAFAQLEAAGVRVVRVPHERSIAGVQSLIGTVATAVDADPSGLQQHFDATCSALSRPDPAPHALFVYARGGGVMNVSGTGTAAAAMLEIAGLQNAVTAYEGYKPLTPEAVVLADPDVVLFTTHGLEAAGGVDGLKQLPGLAQLDAVQQGRVIGIDDLQLLALGIDTCTAASTLAEAARR